MASFYSRFTRVISLAGVGAGMVLGVGCGDAPEKAENPKVALVMKSLANSFFDTMRKGAETHQEQHTDYELISVGIDNETDIDKQIALVDEVAAQGIQALVLAPADSKLLVAAAKRAWDKGIMVVNIDNRFDGDTMTANNIKIPFVGPDNKKGAQEVGECLAAALPAASKVAIVEGNRAAFNATQRRDGFKAAMDAAGMQVVASETANWETGQAKTVTADILADHADLKGILAANDSMAVGVVQALEEAGRLAGVKVVGFDNIAEVKALMASGKVLCTADQHADQLAAFGIDYALEIIRKKALPQDRETPVDLVKP